MQLGRDPNKSVHDHEHIKGAEKPFISPDHHFLQPTTVHISRVGAILEQKSMLPKDLK